MTDLYLGDFTITEEIGEDVIYNDSGENKTAKEKKLTWKHNSLSELTELGFCIRENHQEYDDMKYSRECMVLQQWAEELGYAQPEYFVDRSTDKIVPKDRVTADEAIKWLKPNGQQSVSATTVEEI